MEKNTQYVSESTINLNSTALRKDELRWFQLGTLFFLLRRALPADAFAEIEGSHARFYIPSRFMLMEILGLLAQDPSKEGTKMLYLEMSEAEYIEIQYDEITVCGRPELKNMVRDKITEACGMERIPDVYCVEHQTDRPVWNAVERNPAQLVHTVGDQVLGEGYTMIHPYDMEPFLCQSDDDYAACTTGIEYIELISTVQPGRCILFADQSKTIYACGISWNDYCELSDILDGHNRTKEPYLV